MPDRLKTIIASVLDMSPREIGDDASPETLPNWDSVRQMDLMLAVEDEFKLRFSDEEISSLTSYASIRDAILTRGIVLS
jgi:acyl carrier protein